MNRMVNKLINKYFKIDEKAKKHAQQILINQNFTPISETKDNDIFIAGFPKSGNTWMQNLVTGLILESTSFRITPQLVSEFVPDMHAVKYYKRIYPVMVFKTHDLPKSRYKKVIHIVRDGRDAMISYYKMEINRDKNYKYSLSDMITEGKGVFPVKWNLHSKKWLENPFNAEIIIIKYEDLLLNPLMVLKKICSFMNLVINDEKLLKIYEANNISVLRMKVEKYGWDYDYVYKNKKSNSFFRKGLIGGYMDELPIGLEEYFVNESKDELKRFNYIF